MQWLQKISHLKLLRWIPRFKPVYDAYFAPLKDEHHYWFGILLLVRGVLLVVFASVHPDVNNFLLLIVSALLLCYANYNRVYKARQVQYAENFFLINLIVIGGSKVVSQDMTHATVYVSIFLTFTGFCGVVIWNAVVQIFFKLRNVTADETTIDSIPTRNRKLDDDQQWDSISDEDEPLLEVNRSA